MTTRPADGILGLRPADGGLPPAAWLWLGGWSLGGQGFGPHDEREARRTVELAFEYGIRHFDTAGLYAHGRSEELLAKVLRKVRRQVFIASKGGLVWQGKNVRHDGRPEALRAALHAGLRRLGSDYLDLFQLHWPDPAVAVTESIDALRAFQSEGLIRHWGVANLDVKMLTRAIPARAGVPHQVHFNPLNPALETLRAGHALGRCLNCVVSPFEQGLLAGGRASHGLAKLGKGDVRRRNVLFAEEAALAWVHRFQALVSESGLRRVQVILFWLLSHSEVDCVIAGARTTGQLMELAQCFAFAPASANPSDDRENRRSIVKQRLGEALWGHLQRGS